jgi:hypothetical protein
LGIRTLLAGPTLLNRCDTLDPDVFRREKRYLLFTLQHA